jgi:hypothetical protein
VLEKLQFDDVNLTLGLIEALSFSCCCCCCYLGAFNLSLLLLNFFKAKSFARAFCILREQSKELLHFREQKQRALPELCI